MKKIIQIFLIILMLLVMVGCDESVSIKLNDNTVNFKLSDIWATDEKVDMADENQCWIPIFFKGKTEKWEALGSLSFIQSKIKIMLFPPKTV